MEQLDFTVPEGSRLAYRRLRDVALPEGALVAMIRRGERAFVPSGHTVVEPGDRLVMVTSPDGIGHLRTLLAEWSRGA